MLKSVVLSAEIAPRSEDSNSARFVKDVGTINLRVHVDATKVSESRNSTLMGLFLKPSCGNISDPVMNFSSFSRSESKEKFSIAPNFLHSQITLSKIMTHYVCRNLATNLSKKMIDFLAGNIDLL